MADIFTRLKQGETVKNNDAESSTLSEACHITRRLLLKLNNTAEQDDIRTILKEITGRDIDNSVRVFPPLYINYGKNTMIGKGVFINFDCVFLDLGGITIEDGVLLAPKVSLLTEGHPIKPAERHGLNTKPILIKKNAWIGANATILPGVTVGENAVVAAGAVVAADVADNTIVGGVPARLIKQIG